MIGQVLSDRYQIQQQLGKRAGRQTFLAQDLTTQELVVVKLLSFSNEFQWDDLKLFEREAETLKSLSHPAIPRYLDFFEINLPTAKGFALVQNYVEGKSLEEHLKSGRSFNETDLKQIATALLEILIYLHGRQPPVIHRDIKPSNILLTNRSGHSVGEVYLVDFGSVQTLAAREGSTITVVGTYGYMPPEQFGGRAVPASDLYSLGATLIYLATGTHPADLPQIDLQIQFEKVANLSFNLTKWLKLMTEPSLNRRLATAKNALKALEENQQLAVTLKTETPRSIRKPFGSKVILNKTPNSLQICIPPEGLTSRAYMLIIATTAFDSLFWATLMFAASANLIPVLILGSIFGIYLNWKTLFTLFGKVHLSLEQQLMYFQYQLFGIIYNQPAVLRQNICKLEHTQKYFRVDKGKSGEENYVEEPRKLLIWVGVQKYELSNEDVLTAPELEWLADELSKWLKLPIT